MGKTVTIAQQSLLDLAIQGYGTVEAVVQLALGNGLSVTDELPAGFVVESMEYEGTNNEVADYFKKKGIVPATEINQEVEDILDNVDPCDLCKCFT